LLNVKIIDTLSPFPDAILRTLTITHSLTLVMHLIIGAVSSSGGGQLAATLGVWNVDWRLGTPTFLKGGLIPTLDVWSGSLAGGLFHCMDYLIITDVINSVCLRPPNIAIRLFTTTCI
jgi:hypothetical protein